MPSHSHSKGTYRITGKVNNSYSGMRPGGRGALASKDTSGMHLYWSSSNGDEGMVYGIYLDTDFDSGSGFTGNSGSNGSGTAHNNMPPYRAIYMWCRTA